MTQRVSSLRPSEYKYAGLEGFVCMNVPAADIRPQGLLNIKAPGYAGTAKVIANLMSAPQYTTSTETVNPFEDVYGKRGNIKGEFLIQSITDEATVEVFAITHHVLDLLKPDAAHTVYNDPSVATAPPPIGVKTQRTGNIAPSDYVSNVVIAISGSAQAVARAVVLENVINVADEASYALSDDFAVFGIEMTLRAHSTDAHIDPATGDVRPAAWEVNFQDTAIPA